MVAALGKMLRENHFNTLEALDGEAGLEVLKKNKPDLIFLDIILPGIIGVDVLRRIRRSTYVAQTPVIVMSGNEAATEEYYVRRIGADDFMRKPCSRAEVFSRVERLLEWWQLRNTIRKAWHWTASGGRTRLRIASHPLQRRATRETMGSRQAVHRKRPV